MPRPPIDLDRKIREILQHTQTLPTEAAVPISHYRRTSNDLWNLLEYIDRKIRATGHYTAVVDRHMYSFHAMILVNLIETFERLLKEIGAVCIDHLAPCILDNRFDEFAVSATGIAAHFGTATLGRSLCESSTWLDSTQVNNRFRRLLAHPLLKDDFWLFPTGDQSPKRDKEKVRQRFDTISIVWQLRHAIVHNVGAITQSDAVRLRLLAKETVQAPRLLTPSRDDLRYLKRFLDETAEDVNTRVGTRLAGVLTAVHSSAPFLVDPQVAANQLSRDFQVSLAVSGKGGSLP
jgi:hypothetical protein